MKLSAICVFVRDEEDSIQEWIAYHALVGFDTVIVYDNDPRTAPLPGPVRCAAGSMSR